MFLAMYSSHQAMLEPRNFLSLAALLQHLFSEESELKIEPETFLNLDETAFRLVEEAGQIRMTEATREELRQHCRAPAVTGDGVPDRYAYLIPVITASGHRLCTVVIVRDKNLPTMKLTKVR